ncbi:hypothetical protein [Haloarcula nitratireducens]|uniref:hypothetical protein n=1 Tax=Haloarcula nitratireducens TaxID=2487749 RepID=UPI003CCB7E54
MERATAASPEPALETEVACPHCERSVTISRPDREADVTVRPYVAAYGSHSTVHCPAGHTFWVYDC